MSDSEAPRDSLFSSVAALSETWAGPVVVSDLAKQCCEFKGYCKATAGSTARRGRLQKGAQCPVPP